MTLPPMSLSQSLGRRAGRKRWARPRPHREARGREGRMEEVVRCSSRGASSPTRCSRHSTRGRRSLHQGWRRWPWWWWRRWPWW